MNTPLPAALAGELQTRPITVDRSLFFLVTGALNYLCEYEPLVATGSLTVDDAKAALSVMLDEYLNGEIEAAECPVENVMTPSYVNAQPYVGTEPYLFPDSSPEPNTVMTGYAATKDGIRITGTSPADLAAIWVFNSDKYYMVGTATVVDGKFDVVVNTPISMTSPITIEVWGATDVSALSSGWDGNGWYEVILSDTTLPQLFGDCLPEPKLGDLRLYVPTDKLQKYGAAGWADV